MMRLFRKPSPPEPRSRPEDEGASTAGPGITYAVGDVHGRLDLLDSLLDRIRADEAATSPDELTVVLLGDYIDRGPRSKEVLARAVSLGDEGWCRAVALKGNHEEMLEVFLAGGDAWPDWSRQGAGATLRAFGVEPPQTQAEVSAACDALNAAAPGLARSLAMLPLWHQSGDYVFVHAGVKPDVPMAGQNARDLLWIRGEFNACAKPSDRVVVHGHTPRSQPSIARWKIGLDTGAYASGVLSAIRLQGEKREVLQAGGVDGRLVSLPNS